MRASAGKRGQAMMRVLTAYSEREASAPWFPAHPIAGLAGTSFKPQYLQAILAGPKPRGFFEIHAENYMGAGGPPHRALEAIRSDHAISLHGVCMSIGAPQPLDKAHLARFRALVQRYEPALVSEHVAWPTRRPSILATCCRSPKPRRRCAMSAITSMKCRTQSVNRFLLENPSTYVAFRESTMSETEFIREIAYHMGCGLLLDVNNVFVSAANPGFSAIDYLAHFPLFRLGVSRSRVWP